MFPDLIRLYPWIFKVKTKIKREDMNEGHTQWKHILFPYKWD